MAAVVVVTAGLMYVLFNVLEAPGQGQGSEALAARDAGDDDAADDERLAVFRQRAGAEADGDEPCQSEGSPEAEQQQLHGYGWVDEKAGVARIPIDEAKKLMLERGLPVRPDPLTDPRLGTRTPASGESSSGRNITRTPAPAAARHAPAPRTPATGA